MKEPVLHIYTDSVSRRLNYVLDLVFGARKIAYKVINDPITFEALPEPKIVYSDRPFKNNYLIISPASILFEESIVEYQVSKDIYANVEVFTFNNQPDILASIFYVVTLYQEYIDDEVDLHNRSLLVNNILYKHDMYGKLMVERWSCALINLIEDQLSVDFNSRKIAVSTIPTFDIDHTYAYLHRSKLRKYLSLSKDFLQRDQMRLNERKDVQGGKIKDPFDTFDKILAINEKYFNVKVFWHLGDYGKYDRNISFDNLFHKKLIKNLSQNLSIGLHPSYSSNGNPMQLAIEKKRISELLEYPVTHSRQHYLKLEIPKTYQRLIKEGFKHDYTLGFAEQPGFRAGIARPFKWFNLAKDREEDFTLHPFAYMDGTLLEYMGCSIDSAKEIIDNLIDEVAEFGGDFVFIWHNETIGDYGKWKGWSSVLKHTLDTAKEKLK